MWGSQTRSWKPLGPAPRCEGNRVSGQDPQHQGRERGLKPSAREPAPAPTTFWAQKPWWGHRGRRFRPQPRGSHTGTPGLSCVSRAALALPSPGDPSRGPPLLPTDTSGPPSPGRRRRKCSRRQERAGGPGPFRVGSGGPGAASAPSLPGKPRPRGPRRLLRAPPFL